MRPIAFDIESIKNAEADKFFAQKTDYKVGNRKDPELIEKYIKECQEKDKDKAALYWWTGKIVCIGAYDMRFNKARCWSGDDEEKVLRGFFDYIDMLSLETGAGVYLSGKQTLDFDIPYTVGRAMRHNIGIPYMLRYDDRPIRDIDRIFKRSSAGSQATTLYNYAWGLKLAPKTATGGDVAGMVAAGEWDKLEEYCVQDCKIPAEILDRYNKIYQSSGEIYE